jgi:hypothetical protein
MFLRFCVCVGGSFLVCVFVCVCMCVCIRRRKRVRGEDSLEERLTEKIFYFLVFMFRDREKLDARTRKTSHMHAYIHTCMHAGKGMGSANE